MMTIVHVVDDNGLFLRNDVLPVVLEAGEMWVAEGWEGAIYDPIYENGTAHPGTKQLSGGSWVSSSAPPDPVDDTVERLTDVLNNHLDYVASQRRYDNRFTCALRAGFPGPFQEEGQAFASFMDACNVKAYTIMAECKAGLRPIPTSSELIDEMPVIEWPPSPIPEGAV